MSWEFHVYESADSRYDILLGRDILTALWLHLSSQKKIEGGNGNFEKCTTPIANLGGYKLKSRIFYGCIHRRSIKLENIRTSTKWLHTILGAIFKNLYLNILIKTSDIN